MGYYEFEPKNLPERIVKAVLRDLMDRRGIRQTIDDVDEETQDEMIETLTEKVQVELEK